MESIYLWLSHRPLFLAVTVVKLLTRTEPAQIAQTDIHADSVPIQIGFLFTSIETQLKSKVVTGYVNLRAQLYTHYTLTTTLKIILQGQFQKPFIFSPFEMKKVVRVRMSKRPLTVE